MTPTHRRMVGFITGALTFIVVHLIEIRMWTVWFGGAHEPWFLNEGHAAAFMVGCLFVVSVIAGGFYVPGPLIALGAWVSMVWVLFMKPSGPGNIFPIVLVSGGVHLLFGGWLGAWIGKEVRGLAPRRHQTK